MGRYTDNLNQERIDGNTKYQRALFQSYFTGPEWRNVEMAVEYGEYLAAGKPFYRYPYFREIFNFWRVSYLSYRESRRFHGFWSLLSSEYMLMNLFVGVSTTVEFGARGLLALLVWPFAPKDNQTPFQQVLAGQFQAYADFIHQVPFFNYPYLSKIKPLWQAYRASENRSWVDMISLAVTTVEFVARGIVAKPIAWFYNQEQNQAADCTHVLVKSGKSKKSLEKIDDRIQVNAESNYNSRHYYDLSLPRYEAFAEVAHKLIDEGVKIRKIAGHDRLQLKVFATDEQLSKLPTEQVLYTYRNYVNDKQYAILDVKAKALSQTVKTCDEQKMPIVLMHDF